MFEKDLNVGFLLDFYGDLLSERKHSVMEMYYNEDFSLSEIAEQIGISRQGVRDIIKKSEEELSFYEDRLGLAKKLQSVEAQAESLKIMAERSELPTEVYEKIVELTLTIKQ